MHLNFQCQSSELRELLPRSHGALNFDILGEKCTLQKQEEAALGYGNNAAAGESMAVGMSM